MKSLSPTNILNALIVPVSLLLALTVFLINSDKIRSLTIDILIFCFFAILVGWIYGALLRTFDLYYDSKFLYLRGLKTKKKISLAAVRRIQLTNDKMNILGMTFWRYRIEFDGSIDIDDQSIWEVIGSTKIDEFVNVVKQLNASVIVKFTSFDVH